MKVHSLICLAGVVLALFLSTTEARSSRYYNRHSSRKANEQEEAPATRQIQQEEPKPVEIQPVQSEEVSADSSVEKSRPARARKAPVLCNANAAAATLAKPDKVETASPSEDEDDDSWEVISPVSAESLEVKPLSEIKPSPPTKAKKLEKPRGKVIPAAEKSSESVEEDDEEDDSNNNFSAALESLEEPAPPKALTNEEIPDEKPQAVESPEEVTKPKARRSKHHRSDVRKIEKPHRRRVVFRDEDEE